MRAVHSNVFSTNTETIHHVRCRSNSPGTVCCQLHSVTDDLSPLPPPTEMELISEFLAYTTGGGHGVLIHDLETST